MCCRCRQLCLQRSNCFSATDLFKSFNHLRLEAPVMLGDCFVEALELVEGRRFLESPCIDGLIHASPSGSRHAARNVILGATSNGWREVRVETALPQRKVRVDFEPRSPLARSFRCPVR